MSVSANFVSLFSLKSYKEAFIFYQTFHNFPMIFFASFRGIAALTVQSLFTFFVFFFEFVFLARALLGTQVGN